MSEKMPPDESSERFDATQETDGKLERAATIFFNYLKIEDQPQVSDSIFILGGSSLAPVTKASELYRAGYSSHIAFISTGGRFGGDTVWGKPENEMYRETLQASGIPQEAIVSDGITTNTLEEARAAIPFLEQRGMDPKKIILVARPIHQRRAFATFRQQHPEVQYLNCPADEPLDLNDLDTRKRLVAEAERLLDYARKGDIEKQEIPQEILRAAATIRMDLKKLGEYAFRTKPPKKPHHC